MITSYASITAGVAAGIDAGVGSAAVVLLPTIMIVLTVTTVVKSCKEKGKCHYGSFGIISIIQYILHTAKHTDSEEPYYSTVYAGQPDTIKMKENDAYWRPPPAQREIIVEETLLMELLGRMVPRRDTIKICHGTVSSYQLLCLYQSIV